MKSVQIRSFFKSVFSHIWTEYGKIRSRTNSVLGHFSHSEMFIIFTSHHPSSFFFIFSSIHWRRIWNLEYEQHGLLLLVSCSLCSCCSVKNNLLFLSAFKLSIAIIIGVYAWLFFSLISFNHDGKGVWDVGLYCRPFSAIAR